TTPTWTVVADGAATGGKVLQLVSASGGRRALTWDAIDGDADRGDVEILTRWKASVGGAFGGAILRASGAAAAETGYRAAGPVDSSVAVSKYVAGANTDLQTVTRSTQQANTWYRTRFR